MAVRFGNMLFEPLWNSQYIDHIQVTVAESVGVEGRGSYYDQAGAMRDMIQNHLMQLRALSFILCSARDVPIKNPCAKRKVFAMPPPTISVSTL